MSVARARRLRRDMTDAERRLWSRLRNRRLSGRKFARQVPIAPYIVDFCCRSDKLIVEIDGGQHDWQAAKDADRTRALEAQGYRVIRFWNNEVLGNLNGVLAEILQALKDTEPAPDHPAAPVEDAKPKCPSPPSGGEGLG